MQSKWAEHKGKRILQADFANFGQDVDGLAEEMRAVIEIMEQEPEGSVLGLADIRGTVFSKDLVSQLKDVVPQVVGHMVKSAVVVDKLTGFKKVILDAVSRVSGRNATLFESVEEAMDWLVSED